MMRAKERNQVRRFLMIMMAVVLCCLCINLTTQAASPVKRPEKVTGVKATVTGCDTVKVAWKKQTATGYEVYRSTKKNSGYKLVKTTTSTSWNNKNLTVGKKYYYKIKAYNKSGKTKKTSSKYSSIVSATPKVGKPSSLKVSVSGNRSLKLSWKAGKYATGYQIYRAKSKSGKYTKIATKKSTTYTNSDLKTDSTYYYKVRAYSKIGKKYYYSGYSTVVSGKPVLAKPSGVKAEVKDDSILIKWDAVSGTSKYYIYRSDGKTFTSTKRSYVDKSVKENVDYRYRVRAYNSTYSEYSSYTSYVRIVPVEIEEVIEDAVLYAINGEKTLEYNILYEGKVSSKVAVSGCDINSLQELKDVMGTPDSAKTTLGTTVGKRTLGDLVIADLALSSDDEIVQIMIESIKERPVVGISWKKDSITSDYKRYAKILERNGAYAVYLPKVANSEEAEKVLKNINGIFFTGGEGWMPKFYNDVQTPHGSNVWNEARDISDLCLLRQAIAMDVPLLAVCRNAQGLNIAMGGGVIQDIPYYLGQKVLNGEISEKRVTKVLSGTLESIGASVKDQGYRMYDSELDELVDTYNADTGEYIDKSGCKEGHLRVVIDGIVHQSNGIYHSIQTGENNSDFAIDKNSKWLYEIMGAETIDKVASAHHQAIDPEKLGEGLTIVAKSSDGVVEAIEYQEHLFALGLQWHPEKFLLNNTAGIDQESCNAPMQALVQYAGIHNCRE